MQHVGADHLLQPAKLAHHSGIDLPVDLDKGDGLAAGLLAAQMEGRDVDVVAPAQAAEIADEARLIIVPQIEQRVREIRLDGDVLDLDDAGDRCL